MNRNVIVNFRTLVLCLMIGFFSGCVEETEKKVPISEETVHLDNGNSKKESPSIACKPVSGEITVKLAGIAVDLKENESAYQGDLLILHGWNENRNNWCSHSRLCIKARNKGFRVIMPEMGKSVYAKGIYPETRSDWKAYPSAQFLIDTLIPALQQEYCLLQNDGYNMVVGVSAGARGVIRLVQNLPNLFVGAVALSGDYDPSKMIGDNIYRGFLGKYADYPTRWKVEENLLTQVNRIKTPLYLGHGKKDALVSFSQTKFFYQSLKKQQPDLEVELNLPPDQGGGVVYWNSEISNIFRFFEGIQAGHPESP